MREIIGYVALGLAAVFILGSIAWVVIAKLRGDKLPPGDTPTKYNGPLVP